MQLKAKVREEPEINLISLIDVVLLLLIFLMVSTTFTDESRIRIQLPEAGSEQTSQRRVDPIEISVTAEGAYRVNGKTLINSSPQTLSTAVSAVAPDNRASPITIRADGRSSHQSVVTAMDVVGRLGFRSISIATVSSSETGAGKTR
jgi:biopolymer transport protein ExbD